MSLIYLLNFVAYLLLAGGAIRFIELNWPDSWLGSALGVIY